MMDASEWQAQVGRAWSEEWQRTDRSFAGLTPHLLSAIAAQPGSRVLDLGCGAGEVTIAVAKARPAAHVVGIDISADLIAAAQARADGTAVFCHADAGIYVDGECAPDLLVSRHGVMFFADPPAVFDHLASIAAPGARLVFSCFREPARNPWASVFAPLFAPEPAASTTTIAFPPGPFAFADPAHAERCLAGWTELRFTAVDFQYVAGAGDDPVADAIGFFSRIGPAAARLAALAPAERAAMHDRMAACLAPWLTDGAIVFPAAAWIVNARVDRSDR
jgi:SAM-dependent methyltransferase